MSSSCEICSAPTGLTCGLCILPVCKKCAQFIDGEKFRFATNLSPELQHGTYCPPCFDARIASPLAEYEEIFERAGQVDVYFKNQGKESRLIKRIEKPVTVDNCPDRDEVVLRLAFRAAELGYNTLVDVDLHSTKVRDGSFQKLIWRGKGVPAHSDKHTIVHDKSIWHNPN